MVDWTGSLLAIIVGGAAGALLYHLRLRLMGQTVQEESERLFNAAEASKRQLLKAAELAAKEVLLKVQEEHDETVRQERAGFAEREAHLRAEESALEVASRDLDQRIKRLGEREEKLVQADRRVAQTLKEAEGEVVAAKTELSRVAGLSAAAAKEELVASIADEAKQKAVAEVRSIQKKARAQAQAESQRIVASAVQRLAGGYVSEKTVTVVKLPSDDLKGRIIGREGRNIRAIETATGVDVIIDDTPEAVILSSFHPVRREVARIALEKLVEDGRIHPARIEEVVAAAHNEMDERIARAGEQAILDLGIQGMHRELVKLLGTLRFRAIDGQNLLDHSIETANLAGMMAAELGFDQKLCRRAGLLHAIGHAVDHEVAGDHATIAADYARRFGEKKPVVHALGQYRDENPGHVAAVLLQVAAKLSAARPGARQDQLDQYLRRLEDLERLCLEFSGVDRAWAMQAGTEVRIMANYASIGEDEAMVLAGDIAERIEKELTYPGEVRVTVLREARATEIAH